MNEMSNTDKCQLLVINNQDNKIKIRNEKITGIESVKLLGVTIENKMNFSKHITNIWKKSSQKLHALARISKY